jgi:hypothetical protein
VTLRQSRKQRIVGQSHNIEFDNALKSIGISNHKFVSFGPKILLSAGCENNPTIFLSMLIVAVIAAKENFNE